MRYESKKWANVVVVAIAIVIGGQRLSAQSAPAALDWTATNQEELDQLATRLQKEGPAASEQRRRLADYLTDNYAKAPAVITPFAAHTWKHVLLALQAELSESQKAQWAEALAAAYGEAWMNDGRVVTVAETIMSLRPVTARRFVSDWVLHHQEWRSWGGFYLVRMASCLRTLKGESPANHQEAYDETIKARRMLLEQAMPLLSARREVVRSIEPRFWEGAAAALSGDMTDAQRRQWIEFIRSTMPNEKTLQDMLVFRKSCLLANALTSLGDPRACDVLALYVCGQAQPAAFSPGWQLGLLECFLDQYDHGDLDYETFLTDVRQSYALFAGSPPGMASMKIEPNDPVVGYIAKPHPRYRGKMQSMLDTERRCSESLRTVAVAGGGDIFNDCQWAMLCWRTIAARPVDRGRVWREGLVALAPDSRLPAERILESVRALLIVLKKEKAADLTPDGVLGDLLALSRDYDLTEALARMRQKSRLEHQLDASPEFRDAYQAALELDNQNKTTDAIAAYSKLMEQARQAGKPSLSAELGTELMGLLLKGGDSRLNEVESLLQAATKEAGTDSDESWNAQCSLLLRRVKSAVPAGRAELWTQGLSALRRDGVHVCQDALEDVDRLVRSLAPAEAGLGDKVLADLLSLAPDIASMQRLQQRRVNRFVGDNQWEKALPAALLEVMLANATGEGPISSIQRFDDVMKSAGPSGTAWEAIRAKWSSNGPSAPTASGPAEAAALRLPFDDGLRAVAAAALAGRDEISSRRRGYLCLFVGDMDESLRRMHLNLMQAGSDPRKVRDAWDDLSVALAVAEGNPNAVSRLGQWMTRRWAAPESVWSKEAQSKWCDVLTDVERKSRGGTAADSAASKPVGKDRPAMAAWLVSNRRNRLVYWGIESLVSGGGQWASGLWSAALDSCDTLPNAASTVGDIVFLVRRSDQMAEAVAVLEEASSRVGNDLRRQAVLWGVAELNCAVGRWSQCLESLDRHATISKDAKGEQNAAVGLIRARCLIGLGRLADALALLDKVGRWQGSDEQHAQAGFLKGCIHLQQDQTAEAQAQFQQIIEAYPNATVTDRAKQIVLDLQAVMAAK